MQFRGTLCSRLQEMWVCDIMVDEVPAEGMRLGKDPCKEVNGETVQFAACHEDGELHPDGGNP